MLSIFISGHLYKTYKTSLRRVSYISYEITMNVCLSYDLFKWCFKINHIRHFIKIPLINIGMDFVDLPSIFRDTSVQSSIPNYFQNCEVPIICYKYNIPIRSAIFSFNKFVSDLDIETCTPNSSDCKDSKYVYLAAGHVITDNL